MAILFSNMMENIVLLNVKYGVGIKIIGALRIVLRRL